MLLFRIGCAALAAGALIYVFSRINLHQLAQALRSARPGWLLACIVVYGFVLFPSALRWHLMLQLTGCAVRFGATMRMTLIGHLFYNLFFGAAGGDVARSALYARRYHLPLPEVLASAPLDRLLGSCGLVIFMAASFAMAAANGAFERFGNMSMKFPVFWIVIVAVAALAVVYLARKNWRKESAMGRMVSTFLQGGKRLLSSPRILWEGLACGVVVQVAMAASLAFGLEAVTHGPVNWAHLVWTLPVISVASALPVNIAGMGVREGVVLALMGLYGVPPADAVAASLLTFVARMAWALVGAVALWERRQPHVVPKPAMT